MAGPYGRGSIVRQRTALPHQTLPMKALLGAKSKSLTICPHTLLDQLSKEYFLYDHIDIDQLYKQGIQLRVNEQLLEKVSQSLDIVLSRGIFPNFWGTIAFCQFKHT